MEKVSPLRAIFLAGPSATGKSTILRNIEMKYPWCNVARENFENLLKEYNGDKEKVVHHMSTCRSEPKIYEHSPQCLLLYPVIHKFMAILQDDKEKGGEGLTDEIVRMCYEECQNVLTKPFMECVIVCLDTTVNFPERYLNRLLTDNNGIDYNDIDYLYLQIVAYSALISKRHLFPFMTCIIATDPCLVLGKTDVYGINEMLHSVIDEENDIIADHFDFDKIATLVAAHHAKHLEGSLFTKLFSEDIHCFCYLNRN